MSSKQLNQRMQDAAEALHFELAAFYRDRLRNVAATIEKQHVVSDRIVDRDVLGICQEEERTELVALSVRQGVHSGQKAIDPEGGQGRQAAAAFRVHPAVLLPGGHSRRGDRSGFAGFGNDPLPERLSDLKGKRVRVWAPKGAIECIAGHGRGQRPGEAESRGRGRKRDARSSTLSSACRASENPERIACVDISNLQGHHAVGAVVVFEQGHPDKNSYRRYRIRLKSEPDDPAMMSEVISRLFENHVELSSSLDLLLLDGGKGQLNTIVHLLDQIEMVEPIPVVSIAKEREADIGGKKEKDSTKNLSARPEKPSFSAPPTRCPAPAAANTRRGPPVHNSLSKRAQNFASLPRPLTPFPGSAREEDRCSSSSLEPSMAIQEATVCELESAGLPQARQSVLGVLSETESRAVLEERDENGPKENLTSDPYLFFTALSSGR